MDIRGTNALTVFFTKDKDVNKTKLFFCPYRKNITGKYQGKISEIQPGFNPENSPQFFVRPQRQKHEDNISYIFTPTTNSHDSIYFWIQDQYFNDTPVKTYFCVNCQAPQLYFDDKKAVMYESKAKLEKTKTYKCDNCKEKFTYMGIVQITPPM